MSYDFLRMRLTALVGFFLTSLAACGGSGEAPGAPPTGPSVAVSGKITFDRVPFKPTPGQGLNPDAPQQSPARHVVVEAIDAAGGNAVLASTTTDENGDYSLAVPQGRNVFLRAKAQMLKTGAAPTWDFSVLNNTNVDALWVLDGERFDSGAANSTRNLHAPSGWNGTTYSGTRAAAPFAILDTIFNAKELILSASATAEFPPLDLFWSPDNRNTPGEFCPDNGDIGTSFYIPEGGPDECAPVSELPSGIYVLGDFAEGNGDTDEFDAHVVAHEFGHYFEDRFSRSDSLGGEHQPGERLDLRLAFGEGWGNAYSAMALSDPVYRDSQRGITQDFGFQLDFDASSADNNPEGWFSEFSVGEFLWDVFDGGDNDDDGLALGFAPIFAAMTDGQRSTDALTSIFSFADSLRRVSPGAASGINVLLSGEAISNSDHFGDQEQNDGGSLTALPIYNPIDLNAGQTAPGVICTSNTFGDEKLGYSRFLRLSLAADAIVTMTVEGAPGPTNTVPAEDPDIYVYRRGELVAFGESDQSRFERIPQQPLTAGTYVIEVLDFLLTGANPQSCMTVSVMGVS